MKRLIYITSFTLAFLLLASASLTAHASEQSQGTQFETPTPGPDGRILYTVQAGDSCIRVSLLTGVPVDQLRALNRLDENCTLSVGAPLIIGVGGPSGATPTSGPEVTPTTGPATPTPLPGEATVCVLLYDDLNGDALRQDSEVSIPNGAVGVTGTSGQYSQTQNTVAGIDPVCFEKVVEGTYNISVAAPEGYNATTQLNYTLDIKGGDQIFVDFGAQQAGQAKPQDPGSEPGSNNLLGIIGGLLLLAGLGLGVYAWQVYGRKPSYNLRKPPSGQPPLPR